MSDPKISVTKGSTKGGSPPQDETVPMDETKADKLLAPVDISTIKGGAIQVENP